MTVRSSWHAIIKCALINEQSTMSYELNARFLLGLLLLPGVQLIPELP